MRVSVALACLLTMLAIPARAGDVQLTMRDGLVTLTATNATLEEILDSWAQVGQATIVNGSALPEDPMTLQLADVPEADALEVILRSVSGYLAAPRRTLEPGLSRFDRIHVLATTSAPTAAAVPAPFPQPRPAPEFNNQSPLMNLPPNPTAFEQGIPGFDPDAAPTGRGPLFGSFPPPVQAQPGRGPATQPATPAGQPGGFSTGVAVPGMLVPVPEDQSGPPSIPPPPGSPPADSR